MPEGIAAPAAPAAPVQTSAAPATSAAARNNAGQFSPKDGATGQPPPAVKPGAPPAPVQTPTQKAEAARLKFKIDNEEVELDEKTAVEREKELRWRRKQQNETATIKKEVDELIRLARTDEDAFFERIGVDVDARAERKLQERLRLSQLTPEQQELEQIKAELAREKKGIDGEKQKIAEAAKAQQRQQLQAQNREEYEAALGHSVLPHSRAKLFLMTQIQRGQRDNGAPKLSPEQLGKAYDEMMFTALDEVVKGGAKPELLARWPDLPKVAVSSLEKLDGSQLLQALGPALKRKVLEASVAEFKGQQTIPVRQQNEPPAERPQSTGSFDEVELERRKRELLKEYR